MDELLDRSEQVRRCLDMNDAATVRESVDSLNNRLQQVSSQAQARQRQVAAYKHDWLTYQVSPPHIDRYQCTVSSWCFRLHM